MRLWIWNIQTFSSVYIWQRKKLAWIRYGFGTTSPKLCSARRWNLLCSTLEWPLLGVKCPESKCDRGIRENDLAIFCSDLLCFALLCYVVGPALLWNDLFIMRLSSSNSLFPLWKLVLFVNNGRYCSNWLLCIHLEISTILYVTRKYSQLIQRFGSPYPFTNSWNKAFWLSLGLCKLFIETFPR